MLELVCMKKALRLEFIIFELCLFIAIAFFSYDFLPKNYNEYRKICTQEWSNDAKQYQICTQPYYKQTALDKNMIAILAAAILIAPVVYLRKRSS